MIFLVSLFFRGDPFSSQWKKFALLFSFQFGIHNGTVQSLKGTFGTGGNLAVVIALLKSLGRR